MIKLTTQAAEAIRQAAARSDAEGMFLRIAARPWNGGSIMYGMGFDERRNGDLLTKSNGITIVVTPHHRPLLAGTVVHLVVLNDGTSRFVFVNPNDLGCATSLGKCDGCAESCRPRDPTRPCMPSDFAASAA